MKTKISKEELKTDTFLTFSDKLLEQVVKWRIPLGIIVAVGLAGGLGYVAYDFYGSWQEKQANEALFPLDTEMDKTLKSIEVKKAESTRDKKGPFKVDYQTEFGPLSDKITNAINAHAHSRTAQTSAIELAGLMLQYDQAPKAIELLKPLAPQGEAKNLLQGLLKSQLAAAYSKTGDFKSAITNYDQIIVNKELNFLHGEAMLKKAICLEKTGDINQARTTLEKLAAEHPDTQAGIAAKSYSRLLNLPTAVK